MQKHPLVQILVTSYLITIAAVLSAETADPLKPLNRKTFALNETLDAYIARPTAKVYKKLTPRVVQRGVSNFFSNLEDVNILLNNLLQLKIKDASSDAGRIAINSTLGLAGLFDPASTFGLAKHNEDWGQTLAVWHVGDGAYLVLPILGPSTMRDGIGLALDTVLYPIRFIHDVPARNSIYLMDKVVERAQLLSLETLIVGDRYTFLRDAYLQRRIYLINDGEVEDTFDDEY
ncbi:MAG: VacJ family lipoprotein [Gammaproteobacteria bacterium]|nr:VacJ family lipoprotein [Gammaproteobacteria bacterium]